MPKFVVEREIPGAVELFAKNKKTIAQKSNGVLKDLGPEIQWVHSYVSGDKVYCVYIAPNEEMLREHGRRGGFPVNRVSEVKMLIDPTSEA